MVSTSPKIEKICLRGVEAMKFPIAPADLDDGMLRNVLRCMERVWLGEGVMMTKAPHSSRHDCGTA